MNLQIIALVLLASSCASISNIPPYIEVSVSSVMYDTVETIVTPTSNRYCTREGTHELADQCSSSAGTMLFRNTSDAVEYAQKLASKSCQSQIAIPVGYRQGTSQGGTTPISCYSSRTFTSCNGGKTLLNYHTIQTWKCQPASKNSNDLSLQDSLLSDEQLAIINGPEINE